MERESRVHAQKSPPRRLAINRELDEHTSRIKELMHHDYLLLEEENMQLKNKCKKVHELEEKVELVLKTNEQLFIENEKLGKLVEDKILEVESLNRKLDNVKRNSEGMNDYERKKFLLEIEKLQKEVEEVEASKNAKIKEIRAKQEKEMEYVQVENEKCMKLYEEQLIRLKNEVDQKDRDINLYENKFRKNETDREFELRGMVDENNRIKEELRKSEQYIKLYEGIKEEKEIAIQMRMQEDQNYSNKIRDLTEKYKIESDRYKAEIRELEEIRGGLESRIKKQDRLIVELEEKLLSYKKIAEEFDTNEQVLHREIEGYKAKMKELQILNDKEFEALKDKFENLRGQEMAEMKDHQMEYRKYMENELIKLEKIIDNKERELDYLSEEKAAMKEQFVEEGNQMKKDLIHLENEYRETEFLHKEQMSKVELSYREKIKRIGEENDSLIRKLENEYKIKIEKLESEYISKVERIENDLSNSERDKRKYLDDLNKKTNESIAYKEIIDNQKDEIKANIRKSEDREKILKKSEEEWKRSCFDLKNQCEQMEEDFDKEKDKIQKEYDSKEQLIRDEMSVYKKEIDNLERENDSMKELIGNRDKNILTIEAQVDQLKETLDDRDQTIDKLRDKVISQSESNIFKMAKERKSMEEHYNNKIALITQDFMTKIAILEGTEKKLNVQLQQNKNEFEELFSQYTKMRNEMVVLTEQEANKKDLTLKFAGANADLIATKNMFDVFVKREVLNLCSEVILDDITERENTDPQL